MLPEGATLVLVKRERWTNETEMDGPRVSGSAIYPFAELNDKGKRKKRGHIGTGAIFDAVFGGGMWRSCV
jgi:hypothetical protein